MQHREMAHHKMHESVLGVIDSWKPVWQANTAFTAARDQLNTGNELVVTLQKTQAGIITGITDDKHTLRQLLCDDAALVAGAVAAYADSQNNHELFAKVNFTAADLLHDSEENCETHCANILQAGTDNLAAIAPGGTLAQADLTRLDTELTAFGTILTKPRQAQAGTKSATNQIPAALLANDRTIERQLDRLMERYKLTNPDFYQAYWVARVIVDIGPHPDQPGTNPPPTPPH